jgi:hypothetical protein
MFFTVMLLLFSSSLLLCVDCVSALRSLRFLWRLEVFAKKRQCHSSCFLVPYALILFLRALSKVVTCDYLLFSCKWVCWKKIPPPSFSSPSSVFSHRITIPNGNVVLVFFFSFFILLRLCFQQDFKPGNRKCSSSAIQICKAIRATWELLRAEVFGQEEAEENQGISPCSWMLIRTSQ